MDRYLYNEDCISGSVKYIANDCVDLMICDPPFGICESSFNNHYNRDNNHVIQGYTEAPEDYGNWTLQWMKEAYRILSPNGTLYVFICWNKLYELLKAVRELGFIELNHCIWKYNFGVQTKNKFVSSHYHILRLAKNKKVKFNSYCRFGPQEKTLDNRSKLYHDMEDVFTINKEYRPNEDKNINKLPNELIEKLILYSSDQGNIVCDFFMGNFTTAYVALELGRKVIGFEINKNAYDLHCEKIQSHIFGSKISQMIQPEVIIPKNKGKKITDQLIVEISNDYINLINQGKLKKDIIKELATKYERGEFSIRNIIKKSSNV